MPCHAVRLVVELFLFSVPLKKKKRSSGRLSPRSLAQYSTIEFGRRMLCPGSLPMEGEKAFAKSQNQVLRVLEALKEASHEIQKQAVSGGSYLKALLELETESGLFSSDPNLSTLSAHLSRLKSLVLDLRQMKPTIRSYLSRRSSSHQISRIAGSIETEIQSWIDRESVDSLVKTLARKNPPFPPVQDKQNLLAEFEARVSQGFSRDLQNVLLRSNVFPVLESVLCDAIEPRSIREAAGSAIATLVRFNKDVFVGQVLMGPTVKSLISLASGEALRVLCVLIRCIKSPLVDDIESGGYIPKIISFVGSAQSSTTRVMAVELLMEIGYFGRKEAVEAMIEEGIIDRLLELQRSDEGGNLIDMAKFEDDDDDEDGEEEIEETGEGESESKSRRSKKKGSREMRFLERHPYASCVARLAIQLEVGEGLRQSERRAFKQEILKRVRESAASDAEAATIIAEVLWGASPW